jgi:hypothetical protein
MEKNVTFNQMVKNNDYVVDVVGNGTYKPIVKSPESKGEKKIPDRKYTEYYQTTEVLARICSPDMQTLSALKFPGCSSFASAESYAAKLESVYLQASDSPFSKLRYIISSKSDLHLDLVSAPDKLRALVSEGRGRSAEIIAEKMALFLILWRLEFGEAVKGTGNLVDDYQRTIDNIPSIMFPNGITDDALQFHFAALKKDAGLYMSLGLTLDTEYQALQETLEQERMLTGSMCSTITELYRTTGRFIKKNFVHYGGSQLLAEDLLESDKYDAMQFKFDMMIKAFLVSGPHLAAVQKGAAFAKTAKMIINKVGNLDLPTIVESLPRNESLFAFPRSNDTSLKVSVTFDALFLILNAIDTMDMTQRLGLAEKFVLHSIPT